MRKGLFTPAHMLEKDTSPVLCAMMRFLSDYPYTPHTNVNSLLGCLRNTLNKRSLAASAKKSRTLFVTPFISNALDHINFTRIFTDRTHATLLPVDMQHIATHPPLVSFTTEPTLGSQFYNFASFRKLPFDTLMTRSKQACTCSSPTLARFRKQHGHVDTTDLSLIHSPSLRFLFSLGSKFRLTPPSPTDSADLINSISSSLDLFCKRIATAHDTSPDTLTPWNNAVLKDVEERIISQHLKHSPLPNTPVISAADITALANLHTDFVVRITDKSAADFSITCKSHYLTNLISDQASNNTYAPVSDKQADIIARHHRKLSHTFKLCSPEIFTETESHPARFSKLPHKYSANKAHKNADRFIAGSANTSLELLSKHLNAVFSILRPDVEALWIDTLKIAGIPSTRSWILHDADTVLEHVKSLNFDLDQDPKQLLCDSLETYDFTTLYTTLPQDEIKSRMRSLFKELFNRRATRQPKSSSLRGGTADYLDPTDDSSPWKSFGDNADRVPSRSRVTSVSLADQLDYLIDNTFLTLGSQLYRQTIGIPMGTNCAVFLANFFLFTYELDFARSLIEQGNQEKLRFFENTFRYIDDVLPLNNPFFKDEIPNIYPDSLKLNLEQYGQGVSFLDLVIWMSNRRNARFRTALFDKRSLAKYKDLPMSRFPFASSFLPRRFSYNIVTSQCFRFRRRCMSRSAFVYNVAKTICELRRKGFNAHRLLGRVRSFVKRSLPLYRAKKPTTLLRPIALRAKQLWSGGIEYVCPHLPPP